jgi:hypothetical protein
LLRGGRGIPIAVRPFAALAQTISPLAASFALETVAGPMAKSHRASLLESLPERELFLEAGYLRRQSFCGYDRRLFRRNRLDCIVRSACDGGSLGAGAGALAVSY